ncbi:MAG TPA: YCF48-related protein [Candidatus Sulfotelmatobacter sp.]|nr:YCF48-related protein [Candidatus Sulfotelmatobacter sp.]
MRKLLLLLLISARAYAQPRPQIQLSHTTENLRGVSAVSRQIAWASGTHGTYLRTIDGGRTWTPAQVPDASALDFRAVVAFSADEAFLMSSGPGNQSRIYHTSDAGQHWELQFTEANPKAFFDSMVFWDSKHGVVLGDPIPDESGALRFELLLTDDGQTWHRIPPSQLPPAIEGEGAFAASNTCIAILRPIASTVDTAETKVSPNSIETTVSSNSDETSISPNGDVIPNRREAAVRNLLSAGATDVFPLPPPELPSTSGHSRPTQTPGSTWKSGASAPRERRENEGASAPEGKTPDPNLWFATGGRAARVFHSSDRGQTWQVFDTPILHGPDSAGIFSIAFRDAFHGVIAGGDYKHPDQDGPNLAFTDDGGKTWTLSPIHPQAYFSAAAYDRNVEQAAARQEYDERSAESSGKKIRVKPAPPQRVFLVGHNFVFDFRPPSNPRRISGKKKLGLAFNAASPFPEGGALVVGPKGTIALIP